MSTRAQEFRDQLSSRVIVADGAMGTMLYSRGVFINRCFDELNLSSPDMVRQIHQEYAKAGAEILETNTFGATDAIGLKVGEKPVHFRDLHATLLYQMGLDQDALSYLYLGRKERLTEVRGEIVKEIIS